jgi:hypothetical protein
VSRDYLGYQAFDSLQAFFSTIVSLLANRALLEGLGVGDANTTATFALLLTIVKDGISRVATIAFAHRFGLAIEPECKYYRFLADLFNDSAFFLDLVSPHLSNGLPKVICLASAEAMRAMCGVAAGASKAALSSHFALQDNLAELNAKEASQETAVGLLGLLVGTVVVRFVEDRNTVFWLMVVLVFGHLLMNYLGVRCVTLRTLNRQRASIVVSEWRKSRKFASPSDVAKKEAIVWWWPIFGDSKVRVSFAKNYMDAIRSGGSLMDIVELAHASLYIHRRSHHPNADETGKEIPADVKILVGEGATPHDMVRAWFYAVLLALGEGEDGRDDDKLSQVVSYDSSRPAYQLDVMQQLVEAGWDLSSSTLETGTPVRLRVVSHDEEKKKK